MAVGAGVLIVAVLLLGFAVPFALYLLVDREAENTTRMDRAAAEQAVRRDTNGGRSESRGSNSDRSNGDDHWGSDGDDRTSR